MQPAAKSKVMLPRLASAMFTEDEVRQILLDVETKLLAMVKEGPVSLSKKNLAAVLGCDELDLYWVRRALKSKGKIYERMNKNTVVICEVPAMPIPDPVPDLVPEETVSFEHEPTTYAVLGRDLHVTPSTASNAAGQWFLKSMTANITVHSEASADSNLAQASHPRRRTGGTIMQKSSTKDLVTPQFRSMLIELPVHTADALDELKLRRQRREGRLISKKQIVIEALEQFVKNSAE